MELADIDDEKSNGQRKLPIIYTQKGIDGRGHVQISESSTSTETGQSKLCFGGP